MTPKTRSLREFRNPIGCLILLAAFAVAAGCSTAESPAGSSSNMNHVLPSGQSVAGWLVTPSGGTHASSATLDYIANGGSSGCAQCHGSDLSGGVSNVSCFGNPAGCHHDPVANWTSPTVHGATAKKAPGSSGFASCQICHAANFSGGGAQVTCTNNPDAACHGTVVASPHPKKPWRSSTGSTHTDTNTANAPVCYQCHAYRVPQNPLNPHQPPFPAPAGTAAGCFNGTMCHNQAGAPHPLGSPAWFATPPAAQVHGNGAKAAPSSTAGFAYCQVCHGSGTNFAGGSAGVSCTNNTACHGLGVASPHPQDWLPGDNYVHTSTATGNAPVCAYCHTAGANSPIPPPNPPAPAGTPAGCFNSTLCHGAGGAPHPVPYNDNTHYLVNTAGFNASCVNCHDISAPSTKIGPVCQSCHVAASPLSAANCTSCHASPPNGLAPAGSVYPNIAGGHNAHLVLNTPSNPNGTPVSCSTCHTGLTSGTLNHYNNAKARVAPGDVAFLSTYNAQSGASSFVPNLFTCSNVRCHGGTAPNWRTGVIDPLANCTICHKSASVAPAQYNDYYSGEHSRHIGAGITCTECHDMSAATSGGANHFSYMSTTSLRDLGVTTVSTTFRSATGIAYTAPAAIPGTGRCSGTCHSQGHSSEAWSIPR